MEDFNEELARREARKVDNALSSAGAESIDDLVDDVEHWKGRAMSAEATLRKVRRSADRISARSTVAIRMLRQAADG